jgi:hypothetical protein
MFDALTDDQHPGKDACILPCKFLKIMWNRYISGLVIVLNLLLLTACTAASAAVSSITAVPTPTPAWIAALEPMTADGVRFLKGQYNDELGLLQESPTIRPNNYFLANDALLAVEVFARYGEDELAAALQEMLAEYGITGNDFIEVAWGKTIPWPPKHFEDPGSLVTTIDDVQILTIRHNGPGYFYDWSAYSNLACMAAINEYNQGYLESARRLYEIQMSTFDGHGFPDKAYVDRENVYETLGVAWCVYAGALLGRADKPLIGALLAQQGPQGGFHTHYRADAARLADPNVETTSVALLALYTVQHGAPKWLGFPTD